MTRKVIISMLMVAVVFLISGRCIAADEESLARQAEAAGRYREALTHYVKALQPTQDGSTKDQQLREKIIAVAQKVKPAPAVPEEAERYMARGRAAVKSVTTAKDYEDAVAQFSKAVRVAPWLAEGYYNLGIVQDKAGRYRDAMRSLRYYLLAAPDAQDAKEVRSLIFEIEYRQEKAEKVSEKPVEQRPNMEWLNGEYSAEIWRGVKYQGMGRAFSAIPSRSGPWDKYGGENIYIQISGSKITIKMLAASQNSLRRSAIYEGTMKGTGIEGTMTETWNHRLSCPREMSYRFQGTIRPEEQAIMLITKDCHFDGNPKHGFGCMHQQNDCYALSYLLTKKR